MPHVVTGSTIKKWGQNEERRQFTGGFPFLFLNDGTHVALSDFDRTLLRDCLDLAPRSWENFVDRFLGVVVHVIHHTAKSRGLRIQDSDRDDLCAEVFLAILKDDFAALRAFRGESSLATYLTVISRRVVVRESIKRQRLNVNEHLDGHSGDHEDHDHAERRVHDEEEVQRLLGELDDREAEVIRMYHLEGKSYREISTRVGVPENSIGPTLSRARSKMREARKS